MDAQRIRARRMDAIAPFEVMEVLALAQHLQAQGHDVIHLEVGEPDFGTPEPVVRAAVEALRTAPMSYTPALGLPELREAIAAHYDERFGVAVDPARVVVTTGSSAGLLLALGALVDPGAPVIVGDPGYPCNRHFAAFVDARPHLVPTGPDTAYQLSAAVLADAWPAGARVVIAASPSNPTGTLVPPEEWSAMAALCRERGAVLIADEIYGLLVYDRPPATVLALADDVVVVNSFSKYFGMTGWRVGWLVVPPALVRDVEKLAQNLFICPPAPAQYAALAALRPETTALLEERRLTLRGRRDALLEALPSAGFAVRARPEGAFYVYCDVSGHGRPSFALARELLERAHVALTPGRDFGVAAPERHIRIAYTQDVSRLEEAVARIARALG